MDEETFVTHVCDFKIFDKKAVPGEVKMSLTNIIMPHMVAFWVAIALVCSCLRWQLSRKHLSWVVIVLDQESATYGIRGTLGMPSNF